MMRSISGVVVACLILTSCASECGAPVSAITHTETVTVDKPVPVPCLQSMPARPAFQTDAEILAGGDGQVVAGLRADRIARGAYESRLEAALTACVSGKSGS
jgi:hypothetical protein